MYGSRTAIRSWCQWSMSDFYYNRTNMGLPQSRRYSTGRHRKKRDYYELLGVKPDATQEEIKAAFYSKSKKLHPDKGADGVSSGDFVDLKEAYDTLRRPADRRLYDVMRKQDENSELYKNPYFQYTYRQQQKERERDYNHFWQRSPGPSGNVKDSNFRRRSQEQWRFIYKWTAIGVLVVVLYNLGYVMQLRHQERELSKLIDENEIAKSFMRQAEFKDRKPDPVELYEIGRVLKGDVDEAWRLKHEGLNEKNPDEIREEYRWLRAVQDVDHMRRVKAERAEKRRKERMVALGHVPESERGGKGK